MIECLEDNTRKKFFYSYLDHEGIKQDAFLEIIIPYEDECLEELVTQILSQMDPMMRYLDEDISIKKALQIFIDFENQKFKDEYAAQLLEKVQCNKIDIEEIIKDMEKHYKEELIQFADRIGPTDNEIFAQSFHRLVHSSSLEEILKKERAYAKIIANMTTYMDKEVETLNNSQQEEMESKINQLDITTTSEDINNLLAQQYSTQNYVRKRYESELEAKRGHQKNEYRNWITSQVSELFQSSPVSTPLGNRSSMFISQQPSMEESFTIHLGSQLKHMHNIRILSANVNDLCSPLHADESLNGLNMALGLYSSSLCGVVVLTPSIQAQANKDIIKNANMSTEFHFNQIDDQLEKIEQQIRQLNLSTSSTPSTKSLSTASTDVSITSGDDDITHSTHSSASNSPVKTSAKLKTGDFFITKHSNLSQSHVIFHLISDEPINSPSEINSRHPVILGLRNILKTASRHDVTTLTIPALLRHEMSEDMTVQWCVRRAELVFKCAKGFMIESASWGGAELRLTQFEPWKDTQSSNALKLFRLIMKMGVQIKMHTVHFVIFSVSTIDLSGFVNKQKCRIWANHNPIVIVEKQMHQQKVTVWCGLWAGGISGPYFFQNEAGQAVTVNGVRFREMITNFLWPELEDMDVDDMWFQQDGATCHTAIETMALLRDKFNGRVISCGGDVNWPPRSCELIPLDFFHWDYLKEIPLSDTESLFCKVFFQLACGKAMFISYLILCSSSI